MQTLTSRLQTEHDALTRKVTAFSTYAELTEACRGGYVPTIYPTTKAKRALRKLLQGHGFAVWAGGK